MLLDCILFGLVTFIARQNSIAGTCSKALLVYEYPNEYHILDTYYISLIVVMNDILGDNLVSIKS